MSTTIKRVGRPPAETEMLRARVSKEVLRALDVFANENVVARQEALRRVLRDWLIAHGYLDGRAE